MSEQEKNQHYYRNSSQKRHTFPWIKTIIVAIIAGIIGALLVLGIGKLLNKTGFNNEGATVHQVSNSHGGNQLDGKSNQYKSVHDMIKDVSPAIVGVINMQKSTNLDDLFNGKASKSKEAGIGSGVIYQISDGSAYIVTNNHVVDGASEIKVQLHNTKQVDAKLIGKDALTDIAVLKIKDTKGIKSIQFANSSKVQTGDSVFAWVIH